MLLDTTVKVSLFGHLDGNLGRFNWNVNKCYRVMIFRRDRIQSISVSF